MSVSWITALALWLGFNSLVAQLTEVVWIAFFFIVN
jgi:hypothetical protein